MLIVTVHVVLVIGTPTSTSRKLILFQTGMRWGLGHLRVITHCPPYSHDLLGVIHILLQFILHLLLHMMMVTVVWVLGPPTFPPINIIIDLMVVIFFIS